MKPTAKQLLESITWSLDNKVAPVTDDKWAASTLRSVRCLLLHLATRVDLEGQLLFDDNADLREVLRRVEKSLSPGSEWRRLIDDVLAAEWRPASAYPTVASMTEENDAMRSLVDRLLDALRGTEDNTARAELEAWIRRRLLSDQPLFIPAFMANNF
jgi:hypothetical protein